MVSIACRKHAANWLLVSIVLLIVSSSLAQERRPARGNRPIRQPDKIKVGDQAPDFALKTVDGKETIKLSSFRGDRPVALVFGSYT